MEAKICLITGASAGIGKEVAIGLAKAGAHLILVCRDPQKGTAVVEEIRKITNSKNIDLFIADLSSQKSIHHLSESIHKKYNMIHALINNAGVSLSKKTFSEDGIEMNLATNHLGPFLLSHLLLDLLQAGQPSRIINVSSSAHKIATLRLHDLQFQNRKYRHMQAYAQSKLLLTMMSYEMAKRLAGTNVTVNSLHPGVINTKLLHEIGMNYFPKAIQKMIAKPLVKLIDTFMVTPQEAAKPIIKLAISPEMADVSGQYFVKYKATKSSSKSYDVALTKKVWEMSEKLSGMNE